MQAPWEYFEHFSDLVYVSDMDTHELVYLNKYARELYGFSSHEEYKGKKCYHVIQQLTHVCDFCTRQTLLESGSAEWTYRNPATAHSFRIKDSLMLFGGRRFHVTLAIDIDSSRMENFRFNPFVHHESFINECLMYAYAAADEPSESLNLMLEFIGNQKRCTQIFLYERTADQQAFQSTYCWPNTTPQSTSTIPFDLSQYLKNQLSDRMDTDAVIFSSEDTLREQLPQLYAYLVPHQISSLILIPLMWDGQIGGYLRLDNVISDSLYFLADICKVLSPFIATTIQRRELIQYFKQSSMYDQLTGAQNRHALNTYVETLFPLHSIGLVYCDVIGLKNINDLLGHARGDELIVKIFRILQASFPTNQIYRMGGDEFLVLCDNMAQDEFEKCVVQLREMVTANNCELSVGSLWTASKDKDFHALIQEVDNRMYQDKRNYYSQIDPATGQKRHTPQRGIPVPALYLPQENSAFQSFLDNYYFDPDTFFQSVSMPDTTFYLYCGDMKKNIYFISDNLREDFNFADNLVYNFVSRLEQRIYKPDQDIHAAEMQDVIESKRDTHSVRYRIYNKSGQLVWVHCRGIMKWNEDHTEPIFFSGSMTSMKNEDAVDPITGLLNLSSALRELTAVCNGSHTELLMLCFAFQPLKDVNMSFGHQTGDAVLQEIGSQLEIQMGTFFRFFRLSSTHFLAFSHKQLDPSVPAKHIRRIILDACRNHGIHLMYPCTIGVLHYPQDGTTPQELINNATVVSNLSLEFPSVDYLEFSSHMARDRREESHLGFALNYSINHGFKGFHIVIQPQLINSSKKIFGGEVLLRWNEHGREVPLHKCIPILEQQGMIVPVGKWIITEAARAGQRILAIKPDFRLSLNISYIQILDDSLFPFIKQTIEEYHIPPQNLLIELTETHSDTLPDHLDAFIQNCRSIGISFVLDDFGTAYSSLSMLLQHPADLIKLDRTLMTEITSSKKKFNFMMSVIYACHRFGKQVCIEGVETKDELELVQQTGCDLIQGFYFYRPMELNDLYRLLEKGDKTNDHET